MGKGLLLKTTIPVNPVLSVVSKVFEKLVNNRIVDHLEKCGLFSDFQYGLRSSWSTADLLTVLSDRTIRAFNRSGANRAVVLDISKAFDRVWHAGFLHKLKSYAISGDIFALISSFLSKQQLQVVLDGSLQKNIQLILEFLKGPFLVLLYINDLPDDVYAHDTTLYSKCDQTSDLWQQLELDSELESVLKCVIQILLFKFSNPTLFKSVLKCTILKCVIQNFCIKM